MRKLESCEVATVDRGYYVYVAVWELLLDKYCAASEREATSMIPSRSPLSIIVTRPLIMTPAKDSRYKVTF